MPDAKPKDAIQLLKQDHRAVEELFSKFESARGDGRKQKLAHEICRELTIHAMLEEEIFYPACEGKVDDELLKEGYVEHDAAKLLIAEIEAGEPSDEFYDAKMKVLREEIEHHIKEEEKQADSMFKQAKKSGLDLDELGAQIARRKAQLIEQVDARGLPEPVTTTLDKVEI